MSFVSERSMNRESEVIFEIKRDDEIQWVIQPFKFNKLKGYMVLLFIIVLSILIGYLMGEKIYGGIAFLILGFSILPYFLPVRFRLSNEGVEKEIVGFKVKKRWEELKKYEIDRNGILLSPFLKRTLLDFYRGIYLRLKDDKEFVIEFIKKKMG